MSLVGNSSSILLPRATRFWIRRNVSSTEVFPLPFGPSRTFVSSSLQLEVDEAPEIVDIESRHHGRRPREKASGATGAASFTLQ